MNHLQDNANLVAVSTNGLDSPLLQYSRVVFTSSSNKIVLVLRDDEH